MFVSARVCDIIIYSPNVHRPPRTSSFTDDVRTTILIQARVLESVSMCVCDTNIRIVLCGVCVYI